MYYNKTNKIVTLKAVIVDAELHVFTQSFKGIHKHPIFLIALVTDLRQSKI